jgi:hypothetical protein
VELNRLIISLIFLTHLAMHGIFYLAVCMIISIFYNIILNILNVSYYEYGIVFT